MTQCNGVCLKNRPPPRKYVRGCRWYPPGVRYCGYCETRIVQECRACICCGTPTRGTPHLAPFKEKYRQLAMQRAM